MCLPTGGQQTSQASPVLLALLPRSKDLSMATTRIHSFPPQAVPELLGPGKRLILAPGHTAPISTAESLTEIV